MGYLTSAFVKHPRGVRFDGEDSDETIILLLRRHIITNFDWILITALLLLLPTIGSFFSLALNLRLPVDLPPAYIFVITLLWYLLTFGYVFANFLNWFFNVYIVTNKRIMDLDFHGLLYKSVSEAPLRNIEDVTNTVSGTVQIIFHYGDVIIQTAGEKREFDFHAVPNPTAVQDTISDLVSGVKHVG